jgi:hypothetical protein
MKCRIICGRKTERRKLGRYKIRCRILNWNFNIRHSFVNYINLANDGIDLQALMNTAVKKGFFLN